MNWEKVITVVSFSFDHPYAGAASDRTWHVSLCINTVDPSLLCSESKMQVHTILVARKDVHLLMWFILEGRTLNTMHFSLVFIMALQINIYTRHNNDLSIPCPTATESRKVTMDRKSHGCFNSTCNSHKEMIDACD